MCGSILIDGGEVTKALAKRRAANVRSDPALYPKMSVLKVGFYRELLSFGFTVWACDADAVFVSDPRPLMQMAPWTHADIAIATDCIAIPQDANYPLTHCDFNTGLVFMRPLQHVIEFVEAWRESIANAKEVRIRDQVWAMQASPLGPWNSIQPRSVHAARVSCPSPRVPRCVQAAFNMMVRSRHLAPYAKAGGRSR